MGQVISQEEFNVYLFNAMVYLTQKNLGTLTFKKADLNGNGVFQMVSEEGSDEITFVWKPFGQRVQ